MATDKEISKASNKANVDYFKKFTEEFRPSLSTLGPLGGGLGILISAISSLMSIRLVAYANNMLAQKNALITKEKERAEASEKAKEQFFNNISHEFRTPLTLIAGPLEEVLESDIDENCRPKLKMMQRSVVRLQEMIDELLDLSKLEYGKIKLKANEQNIVELTQQFLQSFESLANQKKIKLGFKSQAEEYKVFVDAEQMRKILANLISNAFKFTDEGGKIEVGITPLAPLKVMALT